MRVSERVESDRKLGLSGAKLQRVIENALVETYGMEGYKAAYERCLESIRFPTLLAIASHTEQFARLVRAASKISDNPKTRAKV